MYKFTYNDKTYELSEDNCDYILNDEEKPVEGIEQEDILKLLEQAEDVQFDLEYYDKPCENCLNGKKEKMKYFKFLEYHFFIYVKEGRYVTSKISKNSEYANRSFTQLQKSGIADDSYVVSIMVCENCGNYAIEIEQCEI